MDLRTLKERLSAAPVEESQLQQPLSNRQNLNNIQAFKRLVESLVDVPPLAKQVKRIRDSQLYQIGQDNFSMEVSAADSLKRMADEFVLTIRGLSSALSSIVQDVPAFASLTTLAGRARALSVIARPFYSFHPKTSSSRRRHEGSGMRHFPSRRCKYRQGRLRRYGWRGRPRVAASRSCRVPVFVLGIGEQRRLRIPRFQQTKPPLIRV